MTESHYLCDTLEACIPKEGEYWNVGRKMESRNWTKGESVVVKPGVTDPDTGHNIGGWQGRISAIFDEMGTLTIQWDSHTLKSMPLTHIAWCEEEGMSWSEMNLSNHEVEPATARDTEDGVYELPLCDLKVTDADVEIRQLVEDYAVWFANR